MSKARDDFDLPSFSYDVADRISMLFEKRHTTRESALQSINNYLSIRYCNSILNTRCETLVEGLKKSLHGQEKEVLLALKSIALTCITLKENVDLFLQTFQDTLLSMIHDEGDSFSTEIKTTAIETLSISWFMVLSQISRATNALSLQKTTIMIMDGLELIFHSHSSNNLCSSALNGWNLLLSTLSGSETIGEIFHRNISKLVDHLESQDVEIRDAASKSIAVLVELMKSSSQDEEDTCDVESMELPVEWNEILDRFNTIFGNKSNYVSKLERKKHRSMVHQIIEYLEHGIPPSEEIVIRNFQLHLDTWAKLIQLQSIRAELDEGFILHMAENPNMMKIFDYFIDASRPVERVVFPSKQSRRLSLGPCSESAKACTRTRDAMRRRGSRGMAFSTIHDECV